MVTVNVDVNVVLELIFYVFCHDHGVVDVVSAGMKICFLSSSRCSKRNKKANT